ncbi:hypothetical protein KDL45_15380, partial [bacterium]|nr:hypothetical protein [bacterium]
MSNFRLRLDRISSATRNANLPREVIVGPQIIAKEGYILAVRVLNDKTVYNVIEDVTGRQIKVREGDIVAGVLGRRRALKGYAGDVPESIQVGDTIQILNQGGIIGKCRSQVPDLGPPFDCEVLGAIQRLPEGGDRVGVPASILEGAVPPATTLNDNIPPVVFVAGSAMNSGKTVACIQTVRFLSRAGLKVAACKLTGVSLRRDTLAMEDAGAIAAISFNDTGVATTYAGAAVTSAKGIFN